MLTVCVLLFSDRVFPFLTIPSASALRHANLMVNANSNQRQNMAQVEDTPFIPLRYLSSGHLLHLGLWWCLSELVQGFQETVNALHISCQNSSSSLSQAQVGFSVPRARFWSHCQLSDSDTATVSTRTVIRNAVPASTDKETTER